MFALTGLLFFEYYSLREQAEKLFQLTQDYERYIQDFKRIVRNDDADSDCFVYRAEDSQARSACLTERKDDTFLMVNREPAYLEEHTLAYCKMHDLEDEVRRMLTAYEKVDRVPEIRSGTVPRNRKAITKKKTTTKKVTPNQYRSEIVMKWPVDHSKFWISSKFGPRRKSDGVWGFHYGLDMAAIKGTPVKAAASGVVKETSYSPFGYGKCIVLEHNKKYKSRYAHLDAMLVKVGQKVQEGQYIGRVGDTGLVRGKNASHLHFEVLVFNKQINPQYVLA